MNNIGAQLGWGIIEEGWRKGPWTAEEDRLLMEYVRLHGEGRWNSVARLAGLRRNGKSCRLRWVNYLRPDLKRGQITPHEESIILELHARWGNRWSTIARSLPGRTDNEIKNYWRTHFKKKTKMSSNNKSDDKAKNRLLIKRQQLHRQQQQSHQQQQQHQQSQETQLINQFDMNKIMSLLEDQNENRAPYYVQAQSRQQEMANGTFPVTSEEQGFFYSIPNNANGTNTSEPISEEILWDGLWNLDDLHGNFGASCATSKASLHNFVSPFFLS